MFWRDRIINVFLDRRIIKESEQKDRNDPLSKVQCTTTHQTFREIPVNRRPILLTHEKISIKENPINFSQNFIKMSKKSDKIKKNSK
jgi:hypothetical protein